MILVFGSDTIICEECIWAGVDSLRKIGKIKSVEDALGMSYKELQNIYTKANIGFDPPLNPNKYLVPLSIYEFDKLKKYIGNLEIEVRKLRVQTMDNSLDFIMDL
ncbi:hypothetical protein N9948_01885 [bacterium]|nr:hypothetical protein [bacterium]